MRRWLFGIALALAAAGTAAADDKAEAVVKKAIEAQGGADNLNKNKFSRFTMKGDIEIMGMNLEFTGDMATGPDKFRMNMSLNAAGMAIEIRQMVNGSKGKRTVKAGGQVVQDMEIDKDELELSKAGHLAEKLTPLLDPKQFVLAAAEDADVNGKKAAVVIATPKASDKEFKLYFDKDTGLLVKTGHKGKAPGGGGDAYQESYMSDFKKVNGMQMPSKLVVEADGKKFMTLTMSDIEALEKLDDKEFKLDD
jgi:hypothetical protein